jgi:DNA-binding transcriptional MerR regulator|tara:strand:- start:482 stop:1141 length:660 start_codon:yes stop_codon:yes gene_type:complete
MNYNISQLSKISDTNKITLRSWEDRYDFLVAERTKTNIRIYTKDDLICAINTKALLSEKIKISSISKKSHVDIQSLVDDKFKDKNNANYQIYIARVLRAALNYDRDLFDATIYIGFTKFGLYDFYLNIMYPALEKIGFIWSVKSNVNEHENFVSGLLETKINDVTKEILENKMSKDIWLLFIMAPYIFLNRDNNHFISLFETTKMVANAEENIVDNWSV